MFIMIFATVCRGPESEGSAARAGGQQRPGAVAGAEAQRGPAQRERWAFLLRVSEANEVPISSHIWVGLSTFNSL